MAKYEGLIHLHDVYESLTVADILLGYEIKVTSNIISITF